MSVEVMTLEEMQGYQGTNPRPLDFDEFWDESIARVAASDPSAELIPAGFQVRGAECFHLYFNGEDGARIHAKYMRPEKARGPLPVVFFFHGYKADSGDWSDKLMWIQQGFAVAAMDCRGQAGLSQDMGGVNGTTYVGHIVRGLLDGPEKLLYRHIFLDTAMLVKAVKGFPETDAEKMVVYGASQGGALALVCAALSPEIKHAAVMYPFLCDYKRVWEIDCRGSAYEEFDRFFRSHDPRHEREDELFTRLGYIDVQNFTPRIKADVLWGTGLRDESCPASAQFAAYNHLTGEKRMLLYPDFGHEWLPGFADEAMGFLGFK